MKQSTVIFLFLFNLAFPLFGQISYGGIPESFKSDLKSAISVIDMPKVDTLALLKEDDEIKTNRQKPFRFAKTFTVNYNIGNSGIWRTLANGDKIWQIELRSKGAHSLNIIFDDFELPEGAKVYVYDEKRTQILGAFTEKNNSDSHILPVSPIRGDDLVVEYFVPSSCKDEGKLSIGQVAHDYRNIFRHGSLKDGNFGRSGSCQVDVSCDAGKNWQNERNSVCRLLINGNTLCTGVLLNDASGDGKPYLLTANHCVDTNDKASTLLMAFEYESPYCGGPDGITTKSLTGAKLLATTDKIDFALVELSAVPPFSYHPYFAGWNRDTTAPQSGTIIHHPEGDVKKISFDNNPLITGNFGDTYDQNSHWFVAHYNTGSTEGGSSGGPLFDQNHKIVGVLTGGDANCTSPDKDYYSKFSRAWSDYSSSSSQLAAWLDANSTGVTQIGGLDPYSAFNQRCDTVTNIQPGEEVTVYPFSGGWGSWTGHNSGKYSRFAEKVSGFSSSNITGIFLNVAKAAWQYAYSSIDVKLWAGGDVPGSELASVTVPLENMKYPGDNFVEFNSVVTVQGDFYVGYVINYNYKDTFSLYQAKDRGSTGLNTAYVYSSAGWKAFRDINNGFNTALDIRTIDCSSKKSTTETAVSQIELAASVYPVPAKDYLYVNITEPSNTDITLRLFDITGKMVLSEVEPGGAGTILLDLSRIKNGFYVLKVNSGNKQLIRKISVIK